MASAIANLTFLAAVSPESTLSIHVPFVGAVVVSVAPDAVVGSVAASNADAAEFEGEQAAATKSVEALAVVNVDVVPVVLAAPSVLDDATSNVGVPVDDLYATTRPTKELPVVRVNR